jgi:DNA polymerase-1
MKLLAVDSNSIMNRAFYGIKLLTTRSGFYTNAVYGFLTIFLATISEVRPDAVVFAFDMHGPTFRHNLLRRLQGRTPQTPG